MRAKGRIPAVIYGLKRPCLNVSVDERDLEHLVAEAGVHAMISLQMGDGGEIEHVLLRDSQRHPVTDRLVHADFFRIDPSKPIRLEVPIAAKGVAIGQKTGGILEQLVRTVEIRCLPKDMPPVLEIDVSSIAIGHSLHVGEVTPPASIEITAPPETALFTVIAPRKAEEEAVAAAAAAVAEEEAEPELVGEEAEEREEE